jgi:hypothetical protein
VERLDLALTAAWSIIDSKAMPVLLEGILLLGRADGEETKHGLLRYWVSHKSMRDTMEIS